MDLAAVASVSRAAEDPGEALPKAIQSLQAALSDEERERLREIKGVPDYQAVMVFCAQLDAANQPTKRRNVATRLHSVLHSFREFLAIVNTFPSPNAEMTALVWGGIKLTMLLIQNYTSYFQDITNLFMSFGSHCPRFDQYAALFSDSRELRRALHEFHAAIIYCCKHVIEYMKRPWFNNLGMCLRPFEREFENDTNEIHNRSKEVEQAIYLAKATTDRRHQAHQEGLTSKSLRILQRLSLKSEDSLATLQDLTLQQEQRSSRERKQKLLESLSSHDYFRPYSEACKKRHPSTTRWLFSTSQFDEWNNDQSPSLLWCTGKIGSGKTLLTASAIQHVLKKKTPGNIVTFFFVQYNDPRTLLAEYIIRSIIRQSLDPTTISTQVESRLNAMTSEQFSNMENLVDLLGAIITSSESFYIFIDVIDECSNSQRRFLLSALASLQESTRTIKIFLAGGLSLSAEIQERLSPSFKVGNVHAGATSDIESYVHEKLQEEDLQIADPSLLEDIKHALVDHADGMFLWISFLIDEISHQPSDDDIRNCLRELPRDLEETFNRVLFRILKSRQEKIPQQLFPWIAAAKRQLTLDEICEAVSIQVGQTHSAPDKRFNNKNLIASWCQNMIQINEEDESIQFAHHTIHDFLIGECTRSELSGFHIDLEQTDYLIGEKCMTYLNYGDFQGSLTRLQPDWTFTPGELLSATLREQNGLNSKAIKTFQNQFFRHSKSGRFDLKTLDTTQLSSAESVSKKHVTAHPFLRYAEEHWISHTSKFKENRKSPTWGLWKQAVNGENHLAKVPWEMKDGISGDLRLSKRQDWALDTPHPALILYLSSQGEINFDSLLEPLPYLAESHAAVEFVLFGRISESELQRSLLSAAETNDAKLVKLLFASDMKMEALDVSEALTAAVSSNHEDVVRLFLAANFNVNESTISTRRGTAPQNAAERGHREIFELLLAANADVNAPPAHLGGWTALQAASKRGHKEIVELLLDANADVNAAPAHTWGRTALQGASERGYIEVVKLLLAANADVNAPPAFTGGLRALQGASEGGHLEVVKLLLIANADANVPTAALGGRTALQAACRIGHKEIVELLLAANANVNDPPVGSGGRTALQAASEIGHMEIVKLLIAGNADLNTPPAPDGGRTALQAASGSGHIEIVKLLLAGNADPNTPPAPDGGRTALQAASASGHIEIVKLLLAENSDVNAPPAEIMGRTALQAASEIGHMEIVKLLLAGNANPNTPPAPNGGRTALQAASKSGHIEIVKLLLAENADVNAPRAYINGLTAVEASYGREHEEIMELLLAANPIRRVTALVAAIDQEHEDIIELLE